jgi:uncharacterized LabA/DUF88 family protein
MARNLDPSARVLVLIDGQNVFKTCRREYGHGYVHPLVLSHRVLAGRRLAGVRYYSGLHDPRINPEMSASISRRHALMRHLGITVVERPLRYRWQWGVNREDRRALPSPESEVGATRTVRVEPYQEPREKGVDLALALDMVDLALNGNMDVAVVFSSDTDLIEAARMTHQMTMRNGGRVSVEAALFNEEAKPILLRHYDYTHQLKRTDFDEARDSFNYGKELDPVWKRAYVESCRALRPVRDA